MGEALTEDLQAGFTGAPLREFAARAAELMLQVALEEQVAAFLSRGHYERGARERAGWRNGYGARTVKTEAGPLVVRPPKVRGTAEPFSSQWSAGLRGRTVELEDLVLRGYVRGLSTRDIDGLYREVFGGRFSKSAASRATARLQAQFDAGRTRDLSELRVLYLFLDGQFHAARAESTEQEGILAAYAILEDGRAVLLHLALGPRESTDAWLACLHELTARGHGEPILDGSPGLLRAVKQVFPRARRQRCQVHKMRNILAKLPRLAQKELKPLIQQVFLAPDYATGLRRGRGLIARFRERYPSAMEWLEKDLEECLTYLLFPGEHRKRIRTTNLLERTFEESRRRTKVIPRFRQEKACPALIFATLITAAERWRGVRMTPRILRALDTLRSDRTAVSQVA